MSNINQNDSQIERDNEDSADILLDGETSACEPPGLHILQEMGLMAEEIIDSIAEEEMKRYNMDARRNVEGIEGEKSRRKKSLQDSLLDAVTLMYNRNPDLYSQCIDRFGGNRVSREDISVQDRNDSSNKEDIVEIDVDTVDQEEIRQLRQRYYLNKMQEGGREDTRIVTMTGTWHPPVTVYTPRRVPSSTISKNPNSSDSENADWNRHTNGILESTGSPQSDPMFKKPQSDIEVIEKWRQGISKAVVTPMKIASTADAQPSSSAEAYDVGSSQNSTFAFVPSDDVDNNQDDDDMWDNDEEDDHLDTTYGNF